MLAILLVIFILTFLLWRFYSKVRELPPGPIPLPLIGNLHQLGVGMLKHGGVVEVLKKWKEEYGDVYTWWLGPLATVNLCEYNIAVEGMVKKGASFASRPYIFLMALLREGRGVIMSNGQHWTEQRRFALHTLRNFGLGRNIMQDRIMLEYDYRTGLLNKEIKKSGGSLNFDPGHMVELTVGNIINRLLFSDRFTEEGEKHFFQLKKEMDDMIDTMGVFDFLINDFTSKLPFFKARWENIIAPIKGIIFFVNEQVDQRKKEIASGKHELRDEGEDFVDAFLIQMQKNDPEDSFEERTLTMTLLDLWAAGQETTTTALYWALNFLVLHPEVNRKLQLELDDLTGRTRNLELADKAKTPYLNATVLEILRMASIVPLNLWREAAEEIVIGDHRLAKGTIVTAQLSLLMSDKAYFQEPEKFKPERFLDSKAEQYLTPFGLGKRACLGESLARAELYLIFGNLVLNYDFTADPSHPASMKARSEKGSVRRAQPYRVNVSKRI